ncbi:hypothetical protein O3W44_22515 [Pantoea sp. LMR881]|uniref:hypothetical protein n=1 Tax=Pantoea sp. LMR881 TaxID=3014336 RepID=UPI0022B03610|nr:hypothetical protein [Pantoea sp. LMR881]MCZ4061197.1 hypothetical protein [Pantoea sp. LMR881]MCZ4061308.1 hypothetical protein [Pantoea sp. LMR881]
MSNNMTRITVDQIKSLAEWCGLQVTAPAGMALSKELQISQSQLSELIKAVGKRPELKRMQSRIASLEELANTLNEDKNSLARKLDCLSLDNDILRSRAMPEMDSHTANVFMRALRRARSLMRLRAKLTFRSEPNLFPLEDRFRNALINSLTSPGAKQ